MSKNHTMDSNISNPTMSILSQQQHMQNQLQLQNLKQQQALQQKTKSFNSSRSVESARNLARSSTLQQQQAHTNARRNSIHRDPRDPLTIQIPTSSNPTDILAGRFATWRSITKALVVYLKEVASVHEEIVRQQVRLQHAISFPFNMQGLNGELYQPFAQQPNTSVQEEVAAASQYFVPIGNGSIQDIPSTLFQYHTASSQMASNIAKELNSTTIPRLEELRRDLLVKIKEIRSLQSDFKNSVAKEQAQTKQELQGLRVALEACKKSSYDLQPRHDPYLLRLSLDRQIKKQLTEENYLHEAFINLQSSGRELEKVVVIEVQAALTTAAKLLGQEAQLVFDIIITKLDSGFITKDAVFEWDNFIARSVDFVDTNLPMRHVSEIKYEGQSSPLTYEIRSGYLERRSKFLKSYSRGWYVLTPTFIHEFKSEDRKKDPIPIMSLSLDEFQVSESSKNSDDTSADRFVLHAKQKGIMRSGHSWVFRAESTDSKKLWCADIKRMASLPSPSARASILEDQRKRDSLRSQQQQQQKHSRMSSMTSRPKSTIQPQSAAQQQQQQQHNYKRNSLVESTGGVITVDTTNTNNPPYPTFEPKSTLHPNNNNSSNNNNTNNTSNQTHDLTNTTLSSDVDRSTLSDGHNHMQPNTEDSLVTPPDLYDNLNDQQKAAFKKYSLDDDTTGGATRTQPGRGNENVVDKIFD